MESKNKYFQPNIPYVVFRSKNRKVFLSLRNQISEIISTPVKMICTRKEGYLFLLKKGQEVLVFTDSDSEPLRDSKLVYQVTPYAGDDAEKQMLKEIGWVLALYGIL